jgi:uncharacterized protein involved in exopolysaccharide biosynthesis
MIDTITILFVLASIGALVFVTAIPISKALVRLSARRLPAALALRMEEEWYGELNSINSRPGKLAFAVALILTRRREFVAHGEETVSELTPAFGSRKSLVIVSTAVFAIAAYGASFLVPVRYESETVLISTEPNNQVRQQITSRAILKDVVLSLRWTDSMIDDLRKNITVTSERLGFSPDSGSSFAVKYLGPDAASAQNALTQLDRALVQHHFQERVDRWSAERDFLKEELATLGKRIEKEGNGQAPGSIAALDHELLVSSYKSMFTTYQDAELNSALVEGQIRIMDAPQPGKEVTPNRAGFAGLGAFAGLTMGGMAVFGLDRRQRRLLAAK